MSYLRDPLELFKHQAQFYTHSRPLHHDETVEVALKSANLPKNPVILDLGGGTGTLSEYIAHHNTVRMHLVEPQSDMREEGLKRLARNKNCPVMVVANGTSSDVPLPDRYVDAIIMANAAHWFLSDHDNTLNELSRILKPSGKVIILYTMLDQNSDFTGRLHKFFVSHCQGYSTKMGQFLKPQNQTPFFVSKQYIGDHNVVLHTREIRYESPESFLDMLKTYSFYPHGDNSFEGLAVKFFQHTAVEGKLLTTWQSTAHVGCLQTNRSFQLESPTVSTLALNTYFTNSQSL